MKTCLLSLLLILCLLIPLAEADERILSFHSDITVHEDAHLTVTETIVVSSEAKKIKHGIYRDFPQRYDEASGKIRKVGFHLVGVKRGGKPEPYLTKDYENGIRTYIGSKDVTLAPGKYEYELTYTTDHQLGFFGDYDELYWNVTGNGWEFDIDKATAEIHLPGEAGRHILKTAGYTGTEGSKNQNFRSETPDKGTVTFETTGPLSFYEGLTVAVSWPKGYVRQESPPELIAPLTDRDKFINSIQPRGSTGTFLALAGLLLLAGYYGIVWRIVGKDPEAGTIMILYNPPAKISPAMMRFISRMGYDNKAFTAALINLAVKGMISIQDDDGEYTVRKKDGKETDLSPEEGKLYHRLFSAGRELKLKQENHKDIRATLTEIREYLKLKCERIFFVTNRKYFIAGLALTAIFLFVSGISSAISKGGLPVFLFICVWLTGWSVGVIMLIKQVFSSWKMVVSGRGWKRLGNMVGAMFITCFSLPFLGGEGFGMYILSMSTSYVMPLFLLAAMAVNYLFFNLLKAPTLAGRKLLDEIEGFKRFLAATEQDRLNTLNPADRTPQLFEKFLPYALALDVEQQWAEQFSGIIDRASAAGETGQYHPAWYSGSSGSSPGTAAFASSLGDSFSNAISSSSTAPGSSSGSGGGGSSGGGGGGGGGGGW
ncbi:MAG: DUF2207 domain-containing protein [Nitrospirae bacterium]|nr:DUF2207 domain-containing protein [Nitrospirota bacterium]